MGSNFATDLADNELLDLDLETQITIQLRNNHYPPVPYSMVQPCIDAIDAYNDGEHNKLIQLPTDGFDANNSDDLTGFLKGIQKFNQLGVDNGDDSWDVSNPDRNNIVVALYYQ